MRISWSELQRIMSAILPGSVLEEDNDGQIIVYTGLSHTSNDLNDPCEEL